MDSETRPRPFGTTKCIRLRDVDRFGGCGQGAPYTSPAYVYLNEPSAERLANERKTRAIGVAAKGRVDAERNQWARDMENARLARERVAQRIENACERAVDAGRRRQAAEEALRVAKERARVWVGRGPVAEDVRAFGLDPGTATVDQVKAAFRARVKSGHSDHGGTEDIGRLVALKDKALAYVEARS
jgi:hypothetical protein